MSTEQTLTTQNTELRNHSQDYGALIGVVVAAIFITFIFIMVIILIQVDKRRIRSRIALIISPTITHGESQYDEITVDPKYEEIPKIYKPSRQYISNTHTGIEMMGCEAYGKLPVQQSVHDVDAAGVYEVV